MRIFIGCEDVASILSGMAEGFRDLGHQVTTFVFDQNKFYPDIQYDIVAGKFFPALVRGVKLKPYQKLLTRTESLITELLGTLRTKKIIQNHDLFIFIWRPWLSEQYLFPRIKQAGKQIICIHTGSDVRHITAYKQEFGEDVSLWEKYFHDEDLNEKIYKIRLHELYADKVYSVPDQAGLAIRPYNHLYIPISTRKKINFTIPRREIPHLVHAPSRTGIKGTAIIKEVINKLQQEYQFTFEILQNLPNHELIERLSSADILVDEILLHGPGVLSTEAMLAGCTVATRTLAANEHVFNPPVFRIDPKNLYEQLGHLLTRPSLRYELAKKGKVFAETYNRPVKIAEKILTDLHNNKYDYIPNFFVEKFMMPNDTKLHKLNQSLTDEVLKKYRADVYPNKTTLRLRGLL